MYSRSNNDDTNSNTNKPTGSAIQLYPYHQQAFIHRYPLPQPQNIYPNFPISMPVPHPAPPPLPAPLPPSFTDHHHHHHQSLIPEKPPVSDHHEQEFALALEMSQAEMLRSKSEQDKLSDQEEQELARALAESLQMAQHSTSNHPFGGESSSSAHASSHNNDQDLSPLHLPISLPSDVPAYLPASQNTTLFNETSQAWQHSASTSAPSTYPVESLPPDRLDFQDNLPVYSDRLSSSLAAMESLQRTEADESRLVFDDEAYARQLLAEEEDELSRRIEEKGRLEAERQQRPQPHLLPQYTSEGLLESSASSRRSSNANQRPPPLHIQTQNTRIMPSAPTQSSSQIPAQPQPPPSFSATNERRPPLQTFNSNASTSSSTQSSHSVRPDMNQRPIPPHSNSMSSAVPGPSTAPQLARHHSSAGIVNPNQFLDRELLTGVSIGFKPPVLSLQLEAMEDPMPNIISLPSKKCPPLHLQAPSWRHMLRLLARLSNTRIEPTIDAMSDTKAELKLRTIIQFVLPHPQATNVWRTILWFTIDQPVPRAALGAARYTCGNPNVLPWSYTLSPLPLLLRNASDIPTSKTYTIPATDVIPYPTLPITFPNLALYLHAVLEESRKHSRSDAINGIGKLGKMVQMAYPSVKEDGFDDDGPGRSSLWKRVMGIGNKDKNKGKSNNETYQMVIPFVSDGWG